MRTFQNRRDAGRKLAQRFDHLSGRPDVVVLALPRGGVPVAYEVATRIGAPLDVLVVRKLGVPGHAELAMGAIASGGILVADQRILAATGVTREAFAAVERRERAELERRERVFREGMPPLDVKGKTVIVVDDGLATGATMAAAVDALRTRDPARVVVAVPVASPDICEALGRRADEMVCLVTPYPLYAIGLWYEDFTQTTDEDVRALLGAAREARKPEDAVARTAR
ncbi:MAG TPA: phosphoribosyltransferase family protein [Kofleriaceae bacterium]